MRRSPVCFRAALLAASLATLAPAARAQTPAGPAEPQPQQPDPSQPQPPQQPYPQQAPHPQQQPSPEQQGYPLQPAYPPGYGPPPGPPLPPVQPPEEGCCRWSVRFDPFQLLFRRLAFEAEVKLTGPFSVGLEPAWIWGGSSDNLDEKGFQVLGYFAWTFSGRTLRGFWLRGVGGVEAFDATLKHPEIPGLSVTKGVATGIFGLMIGNSVVFGQNGGFTLSGGVGIGVNTSDRTELIAVSPNPSIPSVRAVYYDGASRVKLLGSLGLGITF